MLGQQIIPILRQSFRMTSLLQILPVWELSWLLKPNRAELHLHRGAVLDLAGKRRHGHSQHHEQGIA